MYPLRRIPLFPAYCLYTACFLLTGCDLDTDQPAQRPAAPDNVTPAPATPRIGATDLNRDSLLLQCKLNPRLGDGDSLQIDKTFIAGNYRFAVVTDNQPACHKIYLLAIQYDAILRCAELENVCEPEPGDAVYTYKDIAPYNDTIFSLTLCTQAITDTNQLENGRLKSPATLDVRDVAKVEVNDELFPSMLLNDSVPRWPAVWKADPPFRNNYPSY